MTQCSRKIQIIDDTALFTQNFNRYSKSRSLRHCFLFFTGTILAQTDFTQGNITKKLFAFTLPLMLGNVLQQCYNITDTLIVGRFLGKEALAAVGSAYTLMIFLTSVLLGLSMGSGAFLSASFGKNNHEELKTANFMSLCMIAVFTALLTVFVYIFADYFCGFCRRLCRFMIL